MRKYSLHIDEDQAKVLIKALDLYSRIGLGQFQEIIYAFNWRKIVGREDFDLRYGEAKEHLNKAKFHLTLHPPNASLGIFCKETPEEAKMTWDIQQVVRHRLAWDKEPKGGWRVDFDNPMQSSQKQLPTIKEEK